MEIIICEGDFETEISRFLVDGREVECDRPFNVIDERGILVAVEIVDKNVRQPMPGVRNS